MASDDNGSVPQDRKWDDTTEMRIHMAEVRARQVEQRKDLREHDHALSELSGRVGVLGERIDHVSRVLWWGLGILAALTVSGSVAVLTAVLRR